MSGAAGGTGTGTGGGDAAKAVVRGLIETVFNGRDPAAAERFLAPGFTSANPQIPDGPDGFRRFAEDIHRALDGFRGEMRDMLAEDGRVAVRVRWTGTHTGQFLGAAPTGNAVAYESFDVFRVGEDGRIIEHADVVDRLALLSGFGIVAPPVVTVHADSAPAAPTAPAAGGARSES